jgi:hypothetical protein
MRWIALCLALAACVGCMETRYARSSNVTSIGVGGGSAGVSSQGEYEARRWSGPWIGQPNNVAP